MSIEDPTFEELRLLAVCKGICDQYMGRDDGAGILHSFMSAGEHAVGLLIKYGLMINTGDGGVWTRRASALAAVDEITTSNVDIVRKRYLEAPIDQVLLIREGPIRFGLISSSWASNSGALALRLIKALSDRAITLN